MFTKANLRQITTTLVSIMILLFAIQPSGVSAQNQVDAARPDSAHFEKGNRASVLSANHPHQMPNASGFTAIAAGGYHTCGITAGGGVKCWGGNWYGELGDGTTTDRAAPVDVIGLSSGVVAITAGDWHNCALMSNGGVKCWGDNYHGQLGNGVEDFQYLHHLPVDVIGLSSGVTAVAAGGNHTCALISGGGVKCWGYNRFAQLGNNSNTNQPVPVDVIGLSSGVTAIAAGAEHSCALSSSGMVKCWGHNWAGQLGNGIIGELESGYPPADVVGLSSGVIAIAAKGPNTCALTTEGGVKCWGFNQFGNIGDGTTIDRPAPVDVLGLASGVTAISTRCALVHTSGVKCWGSNIYGEIGDGTTIQRMAPVDVVGLPDGVIAIAEGWYHVCALLSSGDVMCWGENAYGQLGNGTHTNRTLPLDVVGLTDGATAIAAGGLHTCALTSGGGVKCWGANVDGQLGNGTTNGSATPVDVVGLESGVIAISAGCDFTCALTSPGGVKCWGRNYSGELGDGTTDGSSIPVDVVGLSSGVTAIDVGFNHACARTTIGGVKCWGLGVLDGIGNSTTPVDIPGLSSGVTAISAGGLDTCVLTSAGGVECVGYDSTIEEIMGLSENVIAISGGWDHTCAVTSAGGVKCWGGNWSGQLGNGTTTENPYIIIYPPVDVNGLSSGVTAVSAGESHTCALTSGGGIKCWGFNWAGQLGNNTTTSSSSPVDVAGLKDDMTAVATGAGHTCALTSVGGVKCWGNNEFGQIGDGTAGYSPLPVNVVNPTFADVPATYWAWEWIERLQSAGLTEGCSASSDVYCPGDSVTRAQGAVFLEKGVQSPSSNLPYKSGDQGKSQTQPEDASPFSDILGHWAENWIEAFHADGFTAGCETGLFCPEDPITRAQMAVFLLKVRYGPSYIPPDVGDDTGFGDVATDHWASAWIKQLAVEGITVGCGGGNYCPDAPVTRAQMAVFLVKTFNLP